MCVLKICFKSSSNSNFFSFLAPNNGDSNISDYVSSSSECVWEDCVSCHPQAFDIPVRFSQKKKTETKGSTFSLKTQFWTNLHPFYYNFHFVVVWVKQILCNLVKKHRTLTIERICIAFLDTSPLLCNDVRYGPINSNYQNYFFFFSAMKIHKLLNR